MSFRIVGDSCTDLTDELKKDARIRLVPLSIEIEGEIIVDDESFQQLDFLEKVAKSKECAKSSCPSPERFMQEFEGEDDVYVVTLSSKLSGSYNSAELAKRLFLEENNHKNIAIIDSESASVGQTLLVRKIMEFANKGMSFSEVVEQVGIFRDNMKTKFVLESLETLRKNGRLNNITAVICSALNIKPIMGAEKGTIVKLDQARGIERALLRMVKYIEQDTKNAETRTLAISHCNNYERALFVRNEIMKKVPFADCFIADTKGISSLYASDGGIIVCY